MIATITSETIFSLLVCCMHCLTFVYEGTGRDRHLVLFWVVPLSRWLSSRGPRTDILSQSWWAYLANLFPAVWYRRRWQTWDLHTGKRVPIVLWGYTPVWHCSSKKISILNMSSSQTPWRASETSCLCWNNIPVSCRTNNTVLYQYLKEDPA